MNKEGLIQSNKGFTLVELCVVLALITILAATTTLSLVRWQENSTYNQQLENAELIYMAAKNKITILKANGVLNDYFGKINENTYNINGKSHSFITCYKGDYSNYKKTNEADGTKLLFDLLIDHVYDKSMLNASIAIEYDEDGRIYSVYYTAKPIRFIFDGASTSKSINLLDNNSIKDTNLYKYKIGHINSED